MATKFAGEGVEVASLAATTTVSAAADGLSQGGNKVADEFAITVDLLAASVDKTIFTADRAYQVTGFKEVHSVIGGSGATVRPRKITDTSAPGAAASATVVELTTAAIGLETTINTVVTPTVSATAADMLLAAGNRIALDFAGTLTGLVGSLTIYLRPV